MQWSICLYLVYTSCLVRVIVWFMYPMYIPPTEEKAEVVPPQIIPLVSQQYQAIEQTAQGSFPLPDFPTYDQKVEASPVS